MTDKLFREADALARRGDLYGAREKCAQALEGGKADGETLHLYGLVELGLGHQEDACLLLQRAVRSHPESAVYHNSLGRALWEGGRLFEAENAFAAAVTLRPDFADAWANLAMALLALQESTRMVENAIHSALRLEPEHALALRALADLRGAQGRSGERAALLERLAAQKKPDEGELLAKAALCRAEEQDYARAAQLLARAVRFFPEDGEFDKALGEVLGEAGYPAEAKKAFALGAAKRNGRALWRYRHLGYCPEYFADAAHMDAYWDWVNAELDAALAEGPVFDRNELLASGFSASFNITHLWRSPLPVLQKTAEFFLPSFALERPEPTGRLQRTGLVRVGFVVGPQHGAGFVRFTGPLVMGMDQRRFERVLIYPRSEGHFFAGLAGPGIIHAPHDGSVSAAAKLAAEARPDVVYHWKAGENAWTLHAPLMNMAPVQCSSWATHGTSGIARVDYSVSWDRAEVAAAGEHYAEDLYRLPVPPFIQQGARRTPPQTRADLGLPTKGTLYFCPNRLPKYHPEFDAYLKAILDADQSAYILLLMYGSMPALAQVRQRITRNVGEALAGRLLFLPRCSMERYAMVMAACDIVLTSPSYDGAITAYDAFSAGKPMVAQLGDRLVNRYAAAKYWSMGIDDAPIAVDMASYVNAALDLSRNRERRHDLGRRLRERSAMFADAQAIVPEWERFFLWAVQRAEGA